VGVKEMPDLEKWISSDENRKQRGVLSIVGFGGVGKTTVAMALYRKLGPLFQCRAMVTVSQNADPEVVLKDILSQVKTQTNNGEQQSQDSSRDVSQKKIPVIGGVLSRFRLPSPNKEEDDIARQDKHNQIKLELENYLGKTRYHIHIPQALL
jgi:disease resistance protein RPM1